MNLVEALQKANNDSREFIKELDRTSELMKGSPHDGTHISKALTQGLIDATEAAIASGDVVKMLGVADLHGLIPPEEVADADS